MAKQIVVTKDNYGIEIIATLVNKNKESVDVTGQIVEVVIVDDNDTIIDKVEAQHINSSRGIVSITLQKEHTSTIGLYKTYWSALDENNNVTAQEDIYYYCKDKNGGASNGSYVQEEKFDNESIIDKFKETDAEIEGIKKDLSNLYKVSANAELADARGEYGTLGERLDDVDNDLTGVHLEIENINASFNNCATKTELSNYSLNGHIHSVDSIEGISNYATKNELSSYATKSELSNYATKDELNDHIHTDNPIGGVGEYVTKDELNNYATKDELNNYALNGHTHTTDNINGITAYATKKYVDIKYDELFQSVSNGKELLASAITDKGISTLATDSFEVMANNIRKIASSGGGGGETITPITIANISDITVNSGATFDIVYTTNVDAVNHEMSFDGGSTFHVIYPSGNKNGYTYEHEALTETAYPHQRIIRVRDANGNTATSNTFNINVSTNGGGGGSTKSPFLASMYGDPRVIPNYPSGIQFPPINAHEDGIQPNGVNTSDSWKYGTRINQSPRSDWTRIGFWGQVYRQEGYGYDPDNVAVEIKDCKLWGWNGSNWVLIHDVSFTASNTIFYVESFSGDSNKSFPSNVKLNGKNAIAKFDSVNSGYMFHPYSGKARANDYGLNQPYYYCSTMSARLVKWDSSGADNLDSAKLCFNVGGDFWHTTHETWQPDWSANGEYAQGQFLKCTREWKTAYCTNVPESWGNGFPNL